jgi:hypothetical protein
MDLDRKLADWKMSGNYHATIGALFGMAFLGAASVARLPGAPRPLTAVAIGALLGAALGRFIGGALIQGSGKAAQYVYMPDATGTYTKTHSGIDAKEARGDVRGAADAWDALAVEEPDNPWPLIRAGELYFRQLGEPETALVRFQAARTIPGIHPEAQRFAVQKIIDLYLGPLNDRGRALVELRRMIEQHPGTREAIGAREALRTLKAQ